jgi:hypothetical protein
MLLGRTRVAARPTAGATLTASRGLSVYQMVLFGARAAGAVIWGVVAGAAGLVPAFLISAAVMAVGPATLWFWPFHQIADMDRSLVRWPEPQLLR